MTTSAQKLFSLASFQDLFNESIKMPVSGTAMVGMETELLRGLRRLKPAWNQLC